MDLSNKTFLITGASKGIGQQIALRLSEEKSNILITYNSDPQGAEKVLKECSNRGAVETFAVQLNLRDNESIKKACAVVIEKFGHIDYLINNAGVITWEGFENETFEEIENQIRTNLEGAIKITSVLFPQIKEGIINIASRAGHIPYPGRSVYSASKYGVVGFTKSLALEFPNLRIFSVSPGATRTQMWNYASGSDPEIVADYIVRALKGEIPLKDGDLNIWEIIK